MPGNGNTELSGIRLSRLRKVEEVFPRKKLKLNWFEVTSTVSTSELIMRLTA